MTFLRLKKTNGRHEILHSRYITRVFETEQKYEDQNFTAVRIFTGEQINVTESLDEIQKKLDGKVCGPDPVKGKVLPQPKPIPIEPDETKL